LPVSAAFSTIKGGLPRLRRCTRWLPCVLAALLGACSQTGGPRATPDGDVREGRLTIQRAACGSCHIVPGVPNADGLAGPPLKHFANRTIIAGLLPNTPDNLVHWLRYPQSVAPGSVMPDVGLSEKQARDVAAYLRALD
jgi:cytochrome c2